MELIERETVGNEFDEQMYYLQYEVDSRDNPGRFFKADAINWCRNTLNDAQTIDAVPVVRCKDCKWWLDEDGTIDLPGGKKSARCNMHNHFVHGRHYGWCPKEDDFCSIGEKK